MKAIVKIGNESRLFYPWNPTQTSWLITNKLTIKSVGSCDVSLNQGQGFSHLGMCRLAVTP